jgi:hypothetical protein
VGKKRQSWWLVGFYSGFNIPLQASSDSSASSSGVVFIVIIIHYFFTENSMEIHL